MEKVLKHVGVMGMHWGRRSGGSSSRVSSADHLNAATIKKKKLHEMSNDELKTFANRMQLEKSYKDVNPSKVTKGKMHVTKTLETLGKITAAAGTITTAIALGKTLYKAYSKSSAGRATNKKVAAQLAARLASL